MKIVVFDLDGTLIDSAATIIRRVTSAFIAEGYKAPTSDSIRANVGLSLPIYMGRLLGSSEEGPINRLVTAYRCIANADPSGLMPLFDGALPVLDRLRARPDMVLGVATGKGMLGLHRALEQNGIADYFVTLQTPDSNPSKPHPGMLLAAVSAGASTPHKAVMVGDAVFDIEMAEAAGVKSIGVSWGMQNPADLRSAGAAHVIERFDQLEAAIDLILE